MTADASQALGQVRTHLERRFDAKPESLAADSLELDEQPCQPTGAGTTVTFSAAAGGGTAPYQYKWWVQSGACGRSRRNGAAARR